MLSFYKEFSSTASLAEINALPYLKDASETDLSCAPEEDKPIVNPWDASEFPDGGLEAWLVLAGAFCCLFCSFGWINCIGIFQEFYQTNYLHEYSPSEISWIGSLGLFMLFAGGLAVGKFYDRFGPRYLIMFGTFAHVLGLMLTSVSTKYVQIILAQGICSPIGICCLFSPTMNCVTTWFYKRRGLANGIAAAGSSLGGVVLPILFSHLLEKFGFPWAMRICAFVILFLLIIANLTLKARIPPQPKQVTIGQLFKPLTERTYGLACLSACIFCLGLYLPINYIQAQAVHFGMRKSLTIYLIPILNGASLFGRLLPGYAADKLGTFNMQTIMCTFTSITVLALWLPAASNVAILVFAGLFGFGSGALVALVPTIVAQISDIKEIGVRIGLQFAMISIPALFSNPIGGAFVQVDGGAYRDCQIWTGCILMLGSVLMMFARISHGGTRILIKV